MTQQENLIRYTLHLADNALILGHRNSEWTGHGPILEQDIAISNIALDLIGQARNFYQYAATLINAEHRGHAAEMINAAKHLNDRETQQNDRVVTEDDLAYLRDSLDFRNFLLVEQTNGDWAKTILRQFFFSTYQYFLYQELQTSADSQIAAIAEKSFKEVAYHLRWSSEWVIRLGDGTDESHRRMQEALSSLWKFTGELTEGQPALRPKWQQRVAEVFAEANLTEPTDTWMMTGGKEGRHTEELGYILAEMQFLQRAYPGCEW